MNSNEYIYNGPDPDPEQSSCKKSKCRLNPGLICNFSYGSLPKISESKFKRIKEEELNKIKKEIGLIRYINWFVQRIFLGGGVKNV